MRRLLFIAAMALLMAAPAHAQVAGKWTGETQGQNGTQQMVLDLKAAGGALTGTLTTGQNEPVEIKDGTVSGAKVSFTTTRSVQGYDLTIKWSGEAKGDSLTLNRELTNLPPGAPAGSGTRPPVTLQRAK